MMTQYFFVVYAFLLSAAYELYLMFRREWKNAAAFLLPAHAGVGGMLLTSPYWYAQLHSQNTNSLDATTVSYTHLSAAVHALSGDALAYAVEIEAAGAQIGAGQAFPAQHSTVGDVYKRQWLIFWFMASMVFAVLRSMVVFIVFFLLIFAKKKDPVGSYIQNVC